MQHCSTGYVSNFICYFVSLYLLLCLFVTNQGRTTIIVDVCTKAETRDTKIKEKEIIISSTIYLRYSHHPEAGVCILQRIILHIENYEYKELRHLDTLRVLFIQL